MNRAIGSSARCSRSSRRRNATAIVVLEDVHWADDSTLDFFRFIGRRIQRTGALLIATYRDEELSRMHPVRLALGELSGRHVVRMRLAPLSVTAVEEMAKHSGRNAVLLHQVTGGNPFFVSEALAYPASECPRRCATQYFAPDALFGSSA